MILTTAMTLLLLQATPAATACVPPPKTPVSVSALRTKRCADGKLAYIGDTVTIAGRVTIGALQATALRPAPVAVHHAPDMDGDSLRVDAIAPIGRLRAHKRVTVPPNVLGHRLRRTSNNPRSPTSTAHAKFALDRGTEPTVTARGVIVSVWCGAVRGTTRGSTARLRTRLPTRQEGPP